MSCPHHEVSIAFVLPLRFEIGSNAAYTIGETTLNDLTLYIFYNMWLVLWKNGEILIYTPHLLSSPKPEVHKCRFLTFHEV